MFLDLCVIKTAVRVLALPRMLCSPWQIFYRQPEVVMKEAEVWGQGGMVFQPSSTTHYFVATGKLFNFI